MKNRFKLVLFALLVVPCALIFNACSCDEGNAGTTTTKNLTKQEFISFVKNDMETNQRCQMSMDDTTIYLDRANGTVVYKEQADSILTDDGAFSVYEYGYVTKSDNKYIVASFEKRINQENYEISYVGWHTYATEQETLPYLFNFDIREQYGIAIEEILSDKYTREIAWLYADKWDGENKFDNNEFSAVLTEHKDKKGKLTSSSIEVEYNYDEKTSLSSSDQYAMKQTLKMTFENNNLTKMEMTTNTYDEFKSDYVDRKYLREDTLEFIGNYNEDAYIIHDFNFNTIKNQLVFQESENETYTVNFVNAGEPIEPVTVNSWEDYTLPTPTLPAGVTFEGWYFDAEFGMEVTNNVLNMSGSASDEYVLFAKTSGSIPTINLDGGKFPGETPAYAVIGLYGNGYFASTPYKDGYKFSHWEMDGEKLNYHDDTPTTSDMEITAVYKKLVRIIYEMPEGVELQVVRQSVEATDGWFNLPHKDMVTIKDHNFLGWTTDKEGNNFVTSPNVGNEDIILYAQYEEAYTLSFHFANGEETFNYPWSSNGYYYMCVTKNPVNPEKAFAELYRDLTDYYGSSEGLDTFYVDIYTDENYTTLFDSYPTSNLTLYYKSASLDDKYVLTIEYKEINRETSGIINHKADKYSIMQLKNKIYDAYVYSQTSNETLDEYIVKYFADLSVYGYNDIDMKYYEALGYYTTENFEEGTEYVFTSIPTEPITLYVKFADPV